MASTPDRRFSIPTIRRLPGYYAFLEHAAAKGIMAISSATIAGHLNIDPIMVRKDLDSIGAAGRPKIGFNVAELLAVIKEFMGWGRLDELIIAGCGDLGAALMGYKGFPRRGFRIVAGFDRDPALEGKTIHGIQVFPMEKMANLIARLHIEIGLIAVPAEAAQQVADQMITGGVRGIWNFSSAALKVPKRVLVQQEDLTASLVILQKNLLKETVPS